MHARPMAYAIAASRAQVLFLQIRAAVLKRKYIDPEEIRKRIIVTTDSEGKAIIEMPFGTYNIKEITAPNKYYLTLYLLFIIQYNYFIEVNIMAKKKKKIKNLGSKIMVWIMLLIMVGSLIASLAIYLIG